MSNKTIAAIGAIAAAVLLLLIVATSFISSISRQKSNQSTVAPTPSFADLSNPQPQLPQPTLEPLQPRGYELTDEETTSIASQSGVLTAEDAANLKELVKSLPYQEECFSIDYTMAAAKVNGLIVTTFCDNVDSKINSYLNKFNLSKLQNAKGILYKVKEEGSETDKQALAKEEKPYEEQVRDTQEEVAKEFIATIFDFQVKPPPPSQDQSAPGATSGSAQALLANLRLILSANARKDLEAGIIDQRLIDLLSTLTQKYTITVGVFKTGHRTCVGLPGYFGPPSGCPSGHRPSDHYFGRGADIGAVNGVRVNAGNQVARAAAEDIAALPSPTRPTSVGQPWGAIAPGFFTNGDHKDHIHVGYH